MRESILRTGVEVEKILLEPEAKNTLPAITLAVMLEIKDNPDEDFLIAPSDHYLSKNKNFYDSCSCVESSLKNKELILMGVKPERPSSEYGYISSMLLNNEINKVDYFIEKPGLEKSKVLYKKKDIFWNAGIFIFQGAWFLNKLESLDNHMFNSLLKVASSCIAEQNNFLPDLSLFKDLKSVSFDKGFVEKIKEISMIKLDAGWSDLGSWASLSELQQTPDSKMTLYDEGSYARTKKPWGYFEILMEADLFKVKLLSVLPGEKLSLQKHEHRKESWYVIDGEATVIKGIDTINLGVGNSIVIEKNELHRLENNTNLPLKIIEIQTGNYFGEDDIVRFEDAYGRLDLH